MLPQKREQLFESELPRRWHTISDSIVCSPLRQTSGGRLVFDSHARGLHRATLPNRQISAPNYRPSRVLRPNTSSESVPVLHRPSTTGAADIIFMQFGGPKDHT